MCEDNLEIDPDAPLRGLSDEELSSLLVGKCALQVRDIFERTALQTETGLQFQEIAASEITALLFDLIEPMAVSIVALGSKRTELAVRKMRRTDLLIALLQIIDLTLQNSPGGNIGERLLLSLYSTSARSASFPSITTSRQ